MQIDPGIKKGLRASFQALPQPLIEKALTVKVSGFSHQPCHQRDARMNYFHRSATKTIGYRETCFSWPVFTP
jgi:hypothetical protein